MRSPERFDEYAELGLDVERVVYLFEQHPITQLAVMRFLATDYREDSFEARMRVLQGLIETELDADSQLWRSVEASMYRRDLSAIAKRLRSAPGAPPGAARDVTRGIPTPKAARARRLAAATAKHSVLL